MSSLARKHDDSRLSARLAVLMGLAMSGFMEGLLSPESLRTSPLALSYAIGLGAMGLSTFTFMLREGRKFLNPEEPEAAPEPRTGPLWHEAKFFTDPWYQVPAIYCVLVLIVQLVMELEAGPPLSERALWFLVFLAFATVAVPVIIGTRVRLDSAGRKDGSTNRHEDGRSLPPGFRDPWFTVPAAALGAFHLARYGVDAIEEDPSSITATWWLLTPLLGVALAVVMLAFDRFRQQRKLRNAPKPGPPDVSGDALVVQRGVQSHGPDL